MFADFITAHGPRAMATAFGAPIQTVHSWKAKGNIPPWRRPAVIAASQRMGQALDPELLTYLASSERTGSEVRAA